MCCGLVVISLSWFILTLAGTAIGSIKDRPLTGCALGCLLGPLGLVLSEDDLISDEVLRQTPGIFQELVPKAHELRVTVMGRHILAARVNSQETKKGRLDWRLSYDELQFRPDSLPPFVEDQCRELLSALGLVFGCFDFIVTPEGEHVFLEVNEMGQFPLRRAALWPAAP